MVIVDSREHWTHPDSKDKHISGWLDRHGIAYKVQKLDVGDYMMEGGNVSVDRKHNVEEISRNLTNPTDKMRFWREVRLARKLGIRLVVLIESNKFRTVEDLRLWKSKYTGVSGWTLMREMKKLRYSYGVEFRFAPKVSAAKEIVDILNGKTEMKLL